MRCFDVMYIFEKRRLFDRHFRKQKMTTTFGFENIHAFQKIFENMHCGYIRTIKHYPEFQLCERGPKATAIPEYLVQPVIKHNVRVPNSRCHRVQITESLE